MVGLDLNEIAASAYNAIMEIQNAATELIGLQCLWARATPVINSEDVILQEYTLTQVGLECPKIVNVINQNNEYNPGNLTIDLFGTQYETPLEINITISEWNNIFGNDTMPQQGDVVYVKIYHKLFEVKSSTIVYSVGANPMYYKCQLGKYARNEGRKETDEFASSIADMTTSQTELFGDIISQEVADNNNTVETSYNNTTFVDPEKIFDIDSIVDTQIFGADSNIISNAYYDFKKADKNIIYKAPLIYRVSVERSHLIYSCWVRNKDVQVETGKIKKLSYFSKDNSYWYFIIGTTLNIQVGDEVTITRGSLIKINGIITDLPCTDSIGVKFKTSDITKVNKKLTKWYEMESQLKIYKAVIYNLLTGYDNMDNTILNISYNQSQINFNIGTVNKSAVLNLTNDIWHYIMLDISPDNIDIIISDVRESQKDKFIDKVAVNKSIKIELTDFDIEYFSIENKDKDIHMCNILLYENEYEIGDAYKLDMYSPLTRNASKLIFVDSPNVPTKSMFVSPIK